MRYILDACALIAFLTGEPGGERVKAILHQASDGEATVRINKINLLEVYYDTYRNYGKDKAEDMLDSIKKSPVEIISEISGAVFAEAGRIKATYRVSLADTIALAEALTSGDTLLTSDHHEFEPIEKSENINIFWIR